MKTQIFKKAFFIFLGLIGLISCENEDFDTKPQSSKQELLIEKITDFGLNEGNIQIQENIIIIDDMIFNKKELISVIDEINNKKGNSRQLKQFSTTFKVKNGSTVKIYGAEDLFPTVSAALDSAILRYNNAQLGITFVRVFDQQSADTFVSQVGPIPGAARAQFPNRNGQPGSIIQVDANQIQNEINGGFDNFVFSIILHELGHTIGLRHTDWIGRKSCIPFGDNFSVENFNVNDDLNQGSTGLGANFIFGTPFDDPNSYMRACMDNRTPGFTEGDLRALRALYPQ